jgi:hypothetical protein
MNLKPDVGVTRIALSEREIEVLLLRASECAKASPLRLVKQSKPVLRPARRSSRSAA